MSVPFWPNFFCSVKKLIENGMWVLFLLSGFDAISEIFVRVVNLYQEKLFLSIANARSSVFLL